MKKEKLILPISILLGCFILGGFYYASQISKQKSIEKQQITKLQEGVTAGEAKVGQQKVLLEDCLAKVEERYFDMGNVIKAESANCSKEGTCKVYSDAFDKNSLERQQGKDNCFKQYPQK